jgi:hypothetical protein
MIGAYAKAASVGRSFEWKGTFVARLGRSAPTASRHLDRQWRRRKHRQRCGGTQRRRDSLSDRASYIRYNAARLGSGTSSYLRQTISDIFERGRARGKR